MPKQVKHLVMRLAQAIYALLPYALRRLFLLLLLEIRLSRAIVPLLSIDPRRSEIRLRLVERIKTKYGNDFELTPHGVGRPLTQIHSEEDQRRMLTAITEVMDSACQSGAFAEWWFTYGTLLGLVRDGALLPTDDDFDVAYLSQASMPEGVVAERRTIQQELDLLPGVSVADQNGGMFKVLVARDDVPHFEFDLFTAYQTRRGVEMFMAPPGIADRAWFLPTKRRTYLASTVVLPGNPEAVLEWLYGDGWEVPDPSNRARWFWSEHDFLRRGKLN